MNISNKLIVLRDRHKLSQQCVAEELRVSKSTYCRFEKGLAAPSYEEINKILKLYNISYEGLASITLPIIHNVSYPNKLLNNLMDTIDKCGSPCENFSMNYENYYKIQEAMEPIFAIRNEALDFPNIDLSDISKGTVIKTVNFDMVGEKLIDEGLKAQNRLFEAMQSHFDKAGNVSSK